FLLLLFTATLSAPATPGALDPSFGGGGMTASLGANFFSASSFAVQPDGKIIVGGVYSLSTEEPFANAQFALVRYLPSGIIDLSFGNSGRVITTFTEYPATGMSLNDIAVLPDGKIVAVGSGKLAAETPHFTRLSLFVVRYNPDGSLDTAFSNFGKFVSHAGGIQTTGQAVAVQPDGKFVVAGYAGGAINSYVPYKFILFRFSGNGPDPTFGTGGMVLTEVQRGGIQAYSIAIQSSGRIVVGGIATLETAYGMCLARYDTTGNLDSSSFGTGGFILENGLNEALDVLVQPDDKIVAISSASFSNSRDTAVLRYNPSGTPDLGFGTGGQVITPVTRFSDVATAGGLQADGKIIVAGYSYNYYTTSNFNSSLLRYNSNGTIDTTFGTGGIVSAPSGFSLYDTKVLPDGKILAVSGVSVNGVGNGFRVIRYLGDGVLAARGANFDFDGDGWAEFAVWRNADGVRRNWYIAKNPSLTVFINTEWGLLTDKIVPADYDGDRKTDLAVWRPSEGNWYILQSADSYVQTGHFGEPGDIPVPADYDGDGKADTAVFRQGTWFILNSANNGFRYERFGLAQDKPIIGDFDGDRKSDLAVFRGGTWYQMRSSQGFYTERFGLSTDRPVAADYDGDGKTDIAVFRPETGYWYLQRSTDGFTAMQFGMATDEPVPADFDGDGKTDIAIHRADRWYLQQSLSGFRVVQLGLPGDFPIHTAYLP
ncbi:MAG TPA: FG-GAP-like repeat-containing protein, partial [Pyrinomonadaceae bacterium]